MSDLETDLKLAVKNGFLDFHLWREWDGSKWNCEYRTTDSTTLFKADDVDPTEALKKALRNGTRDSKGQQRDKPPAIKRRVDDLA
jgi:hypothetical protein